MHASTILLIDADEDSRHICTAALEHGGYRVLTAASASDGVALARSERPAAILLEVSLPGRDGWEVIGDLRENPETAAIPIVILTARVVASERIRARALGCAAWLAKPCPVRTILDELNRVIGSAVAAPPMAS